MQVYISLGIYDVFPYRYCNNKGPCPDPITSKYLPFEKNGVITEKMSSMIETFSNLELRQVCILSWNMELTFIWYWHMKRVFDNILLHFYLFFTNDYTFNVNWKILALLALLFTFSYRILNYFFPRSFDYERTRWRLFWKHVVHIRYLCVY